MNSMDEESSGISNEQNHSKKIENVKIQTGEVKDTLNDEIT